MGEPRRVLPEAVWFESRHHGALIGLGLITCFRLCGRDISDRFEQQAPIVEPVDPFEMANSTVSALRHGPRRCHLGLEQAINGFGERKRPVSSVWK
jgi:hypothetical protein